MGRNKKLIYGVGVNDADYIVCYKDKNGKRQTCPYYRRWTHILERAYCEKYHNRKPTYKDVYVCDEWHIFSNFKKWMESQDWKGKQLDKDILSNGEKVYSPETCCFVSLSLNNSFSRLNKQLISNSNTKKGYIKQKISTLERHLKDIENSKVVSAIKNEIEAIRTA